MVQFNKINIEGVTILNAHQNPDPKELTLKIIDGKLVIHATGLDYPTVTQMMAQAQLHFMQRTLAAAPETDEKQIKALKGEIYDIYNATASNVLDMFDPTAEKCTNLTAEAILKAENEILAEGAKDEVKNV